jgi:hypothetical protein
MFITSKEAESGKGEEQDPLEPRIAVPEGSRLQAASCDNGERDAGNLMLLQRR